MADTNIRVLTPSRKAPKAGDVFVLQLPDGDYLFGRVISADAVWTRAEDAGRANLIYIYRLRSKSKESVPPRSALKPDNLLISPLLINRLPWSRGYFKTIGNLSLDEAEVLPTHCFRDSRGLYFDEHGKQMPSPQEPVGDWGLASYRVVDDELSEALGIPRVP